MGTRGHAGMLPKYFLDESVNFWCSISRDLAHRTHFGCLRFAPWICARYSLGVYIYLFFIKKDVFKTTESNFFFNIKCVTMSLKGINAGSALFIQL